MGGGIQNLNRFKQLLESSPAVHLVLLGRSLRSSKYFRFPAWISLSVIVCHFGFFDHVVVDPGPSFAVSFYKINVRNIVLKDLPFH